jgi:hypothetical protein
MKKLDLLLGSIGLVVLLLSSVWVHAEVRSAKQRLLHPDELKVTKVTSAAVADHAEKAYCTPAFKGVLQRVLHACGLVGGDARRSCKPADVRNFAQISDKDFNQLFAPLTDRGGIVLFKQNSAELDDSAKELIWDRWQDRQGARYFFILARASRTGTIAHNRSLSHRRANSVLFYLQEKTGETDLENQVGMLWLGSEFAQLPPTYCKTWKHSNPKKTCNVYTINRSAFVSWVDCRL